MFDKSLVWLGGVAASVLTGIYIVWGPGSKRDKRKKDICPGLENLGNTCFLNAVLQSMASCSGVCKWLIEFLTRQKEPQEQCLAKTLDVCMKVLNNDVEIEEDSYSPVDVINEFRQKRWYISPDEQDAHEMFHVLTQTLDEETAKFPRVVSLFDANSIQALDQQRNEHAITRTGSPLPLLPHREMEHPFRGLLASQLECIKCQYRNPVRYDHFDSLSLSIPTVWGLKSHMTLEDLLLHYISAETVSNVECPGCGKVKLRSKETAKMPLPRSTFKKKLTIGKLPKCLCIHIQRTTWLDNGMPYKRSDYISFPEILSMDSYVYCKNKGYKSNKLVGGRNQPIFKPSSSHVVNTRSSAPVNLLRTMNFDKIMSQNGFFLHQPGHLSLPSLHSDLNHNGPVNTSPTSQSEFTYKLSAVMVHLGDVMSGHFVTYRKSPKTVKGERIKDKWLYCSDFSVRGTDEEEVLSSQAYMLIYERV